MTIWLTNLAGLILLGLIVWWFWFSKPKARIAAGAGPIDIVVDNGVYTPARIQVPTGKPVTLRFLRNDPSPCAEKVLFDDFGVAADLAVGKPTEVTITPEKPGEYPFTCQMRMYRGVVVARNP
jgi:plastocyanin domain-containing protein